MGHVDRLKNQRRKVLAGRNEKVLSEGSRGKKIKKRYTSSCDVKLNRWTLCIGGEREREVDGKL